MQKSAAPARPPAPPNRQRVIQVALPLEQTTRLTLQALEKMRTRLHTCEVSERRAVLSAQRGMSFWSWGEKILVLVEQMENECIVRVFSKSARPNIRRDWGVNAANVRRFESWMRRLGIAYLQQSQGAAAPRPSLRGFFYSLRSRASSITARGGRKPHEVLDVTPGASRAEIISAYRLKVKMYHPDRVAGLAPEFQELAEERMKAINAAFQELIKGAEVT